MNLNEMLRSQLPLEALRNIARAGTGNSIMEMVNQYPFLDEKALLEVLDSWVDSTYNGVITATEKIWLEFYTKDEIAQMIDFFGSPVGQKMASLAVPLSRRASEIIDKKLYDDLSVTLEAYVAAEAATAGFSSAESGMPS